MLARLLANKEISRNADVAYRLHGTVKAATCELHVIGRVICVPSGSASRMGATNGITQGPHGIVSKTLHLRRIYSRRVWYTARIESCEVEVIRCCDRLGARHKTCDATL